MFLTRKPVCIQQKLHLEDGLYKCFQTFWIIIAINYVIFYNQVLKTNVSRREFILKVIEQISSDQNIEVLSSSKVNLDEKMEEFYLKLEKDRTVKNNRNKTQKRKCNKC